MKIFLFSIISFLFFLINGCANISSVEPNYSPDYTKKLDEFKNYQECMNNYILRVIECSDSYKSNEDIIRDAHVSKCIKEIYPNGRESCK
jgi:hypothetical protein